MKNQFILLLLLVLYSCQSTQLKTYDFPKPVDTTTKPITLQEKKTYHIQDVYADNQFDGARLNAFKLIKGDLFQATISPENMPINPSAYYAFRLWSKTPKEIQLELNYTDGYHRYAPKISTDGEHWQLLDSQQVQLAADSINATLTLKLKTDTLWIAAQEIQNSRHVRQWCEAQAKHQDVQLLSIGKSKMGKDLWLLDIGAGEKRKKETVVIISRQHPPEVTGYFAMQTFVEEILADHPLAKNFREKYRMLVYPLMNPDGVDQGHWRHNIGGVDLNRDWAQYNQPENRAVASHVFQTLGQHKSKLILGLDFHSTWYDVYYTNREPTKELPRFKDYWLWGIHQSFGEKINERPSNVGRPVSKNWFLVHFNAPGITYEIGDSTPRDFIKRKGVASATEMMQLLIFR